MISEIFLYSDPDCIRIGIARPDARPNAGHSVTLSETECMKLAYRLMSLGSGGFTVGWENFEVPKNEK